jgi:rod shape determining protein RodA
MKNQLLDDSGGLLVRMRQSVDWVVVTMSFAIIVLAMFNLNSAGAGDWSGRVATQIRWVALGTVAMLAVMALDYKVLYRGAYAIYALGIGLLLLVPVFGVTVNNARRWLGYGDWRIQPSEIMKVIVVVALARYLHDLSSREARSFKHLVAPSAMLVLPFALIARQPDLGTAVMLLVIGFSVMSVTGLRLRGIIGVLLATAASFALGWRYMENYQRTRIDVWLDPELYADTDGYQTIQAMIAVGNGGLFGRGLEQGSQNALGFLPEPYTDFPFAVFSEEWGFIGTAMVLILYMSLTLWAINIASQARDRFGALLCAGVAALFFWHVVINVGMVLQLVPVSGITLPFFSAGGSNVLTMMIGLGALMSVSRSRQHR